MKKNAPLTRRKILAGLKQNRDILKNCKVRKIALFGSFARGEQTARSDIDFLVEFSEPTYDNLLTLHGELKKLYGRKVEVVTPNGMSKHIKPLVEKEAVWHEVG